MLDEILLQQRLDDFKPVPLIDDDDDDDKDGLIEIPMVNEDDKNIDLAKANYLNFLNNQEIKQASEAIISKYGVGTCGPRAFYGTTDVHLELEQRLAEFLHVEESIIYSYGFVAISSSIAAYCKRNDTVFVSNRANFPIEQGLLAAKSRIVRFDHNNPNDLLEKLQEFSKKNEKSHRRKFLIIEGISWQTGELCPLPEFLKIAEQFKLRVFLEESYTIGVLGRNGRGLTEYYDIDPYRLDMIFGTLEGAFGSIGGFCAGTNLTIEHQRLSGSGYIFSASLPTYLVKVVLKSIDMIGNQPEQLQKLTEEFHNYLIDYGYNVISHPLAPFKIIKFTDKTLKSEIYRFCKDKSVHFLQRDDDLMVNLNVALLDNRERYQRILDVFKEASRLLRN